MKSSMNETGKTLFQMELSVKQKEIFCNLDFSKYPGVGAYQEATAAELVSIFEKGGNGIARDKWKVKKYKKLLPENQNQIDNNYFKTESVYATHNWLRAAFSFLDRAINLFDLMGYFAYAFLTTLVHVSGFGHAMMLAVDIGIILKSVFAPAGTNEKKLSYWDRLVNILRKGERIKRMISSVLWIAVSVSAIYLTGGLSLIAGIAFHTFVNMSALICNAMHSVIKLFDLSVHYDFRKQLMKKIENNIQLQQDYQLAISEKLLNINKFKQLKTATFNPGLKASCATEIEVLKEEISMLHIMQYLIISETQELAVVRDKLQERLDGLTRSRVYAAITSTIVIAGVGLLVFAPSVPVMIAGAVSVLIVGSILDGLGKKLFTTLYEGAKKRSDPKEISAPVSADLKTLSSTAKLYNQLPTSTSVKKSSEAITQEIKASSEVFSYASLWTKIKAPVVPLADFIPEEPPFRMIL
jgi:hypothetical protein